MVVHLFCPVSIPRYFHPNQISLRIGQLLVQWGIFFSFCSVGRSANSSEVGSVGAFTPPHDVSNYSTIVAFLVLALPTAEWFCTNSNPRRVHEFLVLALPTAKWFCTNSNPRRVHEFLYAYWILLSVACKFLNSHLFKIFLLNNAFLESYCKSKSIMGLFHCSCAVLFCMFLLKASIIRIFLCCSKSHFAAKPLNAFQNCLNVTFGSCFLETNL